MRRTEGDFRITRCGGTRPPAVLRPVAFLLISILAGCAGVPVSERVHQINDDGVYLYDHGDYARARENFEHALTLKPGDAGLIYNVGQCYEHQGNVQKAEETYRLCLKQDANHVEGQSALIKLLMKQGRKTEAKEVVHTWLVSQPKLAAAYAHDGWRLQQEGDDLGALARAQQALELDPHSVHALVHLGMLYESLERPERALVLYQEALTRDPNREDLRRRVDELLAKGVKRPLPDS
jgi:tetratricopeptide (TPR) repeat protein